MRGELGRAAVRWERGDMGMKGKGCGAVEDVPRGDWRKPLTKVELWGGSPF